MSARIEAAAKAMYAHEHAGDGCVWDAEQGDSRDYWMHAARVALAAADRVSLAGTEVGRLTAWCQDYGDKYVALAKKVGPDNPNYKWWASDAEHYLAIAAALAGLAGENERLTALLHPGQVFLDNAWHSPVACDEPDWTFLVGLLSVTEPLPTKELGKRWAEHCAAIKARAALQEPPDAT